MIILQLGMGGPGATVQQLTFILAAIDNLVSTVAPVLLPVARAWGGSVALISLIFVCFKWMMEAAVGQPFVGVADFILWMCRVLTGGFMLGFYNRPVFGTVSLAGFFQSVGLEIAGLINISNLDSLLALINTAEANLQHPHAWDIFAVFLYYEIAGSLIVLDIALLLVTSAGFFAIGLGLVFGPIAIVFYLMPTERLREKFWTWVNFMWVYSMYRAVAAAYVFVVAQFLTNFFLTAVAGNYSLGHMLALSAYMLSSVFVVVFGAFKVPGWTAELFGGIGHNGSGFEGFVRSTVYLLWA